MITAPPYIKPKTPAVTHSIAVRFDSPRTLIIGFKNLGKYSSHPSDFRDSRVIMMAIMITSILRSNRIVLIAQTSKTSTNGVATIRSDGTMTLLVVSPKN